jgi:hypothetical protein
MNLFRRLLAVAGVCILLSLTSAPLVRAETLAFVEIPLGAFHNEKPIELQGLVSSQSLTIPIPENWAPGNETWIELVSRTHPLLDQDRTSLTISLNGRRITTYSPATGQETSLRIPLPADMFTVGNNTLTFTATLYLPHDEETNCQTWDDPARWLSIHPGSLLHLSYEPRNPLLDLASFPQNFLDPLAQYLPEESRKPILIVLPDAATRDDLSALSGISYALGSHANAEFDWQPDIIPATQFSRKMAARRNIIFIGNAPPEVQYPAEAGKDHIALFPSPWSAGHAVLVIGDRQRQDGFSPAAVFSDPARNLLLHGDLAYVDPRPLPASERVQNTFTFEDLGYPDRMVKGVGGQNLIYSFYIPYDVEPVLIRLHLGLVHSPDLDIRKSSFTVYVNGYSIASILPSPRNSFGEPITIRLPAKRLRRGINFIRAHFDLHMPPGSCERILEGAWGTILRSTTIETFYRHDTPIPSFRDFPLPFSDDKGFTFVIPDHYEFTDLGYISRLSFMIGGSAYRSGRPPDILTAADFKPKENKYPNIVLIGLPSDNQVTRSVNALLPQPFEPKANSLQEGYGAALPTSDRNASLGLMQIMPSPWAQGGTVLVLSGNTPQGLVWVWDAILNPTLRGRFNGNLMVVGAQHRTASLGDVSAGNETQVLFQQIADTSNIPLIGPILQRNGQASLVPILVAIGSALFLVLAVLWALGALRDRRNRPAE